MREGWSLSDVAGAVASDLDSACIGCCSLVLASALGFPTWTMAQLRLPVDWIGTPIPRGVLEGSLRSLQSSRCYFVPRGQRMFILYLHEMPDSHFLPFFTRCSLLAQHAQTKAASRSLLFSNPSLFFSFLSETAHAPGWSSSCFHSFSPCLGILPKGGGFWEFVCCPASPVTLLSESLSLLACSPPLGGD